MITEIISATLKTITAELVYTAMLSVSSKN